MAKQKSTGVNQTVKYTVDQYLTLLRAAKRSDKTIEGYRKVLQSYANFLNVPLDEVHRYLSVDNLLKYAGSRKGFSDAGTKNVLSVLHRYFSLNGVEFDELEFNAMKPKVVKEHNDKPLELETLQKMMDLTDPHGRAVLSFLISTGCRADETCNILLSDVRGDVVTIRNEIAKNKHGGKVYLTSEAREYLDLWLKDRDDYIRIADARLKGLKESGGQRPKNDQRLFACAYTSLHKKFSKLYDKVDGGRGKYHAECTIHSCRKYFRTHAAQKGGMHPDLVTGLMRQVGYLDSTYVRMTDDEKYNQFKAGEAALYITRADHRIQGSKLDAQDRELKALREELQRMKQTQEVNKMLDDMAEMKEQMKLMKDVMEQMERNSKT